MYCAHGDLRAGESVRSIACAKALARTGVPSLNRKPGRSLNVYVLRSRDTRGKPAATSGPRPIPAESRPVRVGEETCAGGFDERARRRVVRERRVERVDVGAQEDDARDAGGADARA